MNHDTPLSDAPAAFVGIDWADQEHAVSVVRNKRTIPAPSYAAVQKKRTGPICRNGPKGALQELDLSPFATDNFLQPPGGPHGLVHQPVGLFVADNLLFHRVIADLASRADGDVGQVQQGRAAMRRLGVASGPFAGADGIRETHRGLRIGHLLEFLSVFLAKIGLADGVGCRV